MYKKKYTSKKSTRMNKRKTTRPEVSDKVKKYVKSELSRRVENKISEPDNSPDWVWTTYNTGSNTQPSMLYLHQALSNIAQGTGQGDRIGNRIRLKSFPIRMLLSTPLNNGQPCAMVCRLIIAKMRKDIDPPTAAYFNKLLQDGNTSIPPANDLASVYAPVNTELWTIKKDKRFILQSPPSVYPSDLPVSKNVYKQITIDIAKYLPKYITYNDNALAPSNCSLFAFLIASNVTDSYTDVMTVKSPFSSWVEYEDA